MQQSVTWFCLTLFFLMYMLMVFDSLLPQIELAGTLSIIDSSSPIMCCPLGVRGGLKISSYTYELILRKRVDA